MLKYLYEVELLRVKSSLQAEPPEVLRHHGSGVFTPRVTEEVEWAQSADVGYTSGTSGEAMTEAVFEWERKRDIDWLSGRHYNYERTYIYYIWASSLSRFQLYSLWTFTLPTSGAAWDAFKQNWRSSHQCYILSGCISFTICFKLSIYPTKTTGSYLILEFLRHLNSKYKTLLKNLLYRIIYMSIVTWLKPKCAILIVTSLKGLLIYF